MRGSPVIKVLTVVAVSVCLAAFIANVGLMRQQTDAIMKPGSITDETQSNENPVITVLLQADRAMKSDSVTALKDAMKEYYWRYNRWPADTAATIGGEFDTDERYIDELLVRDGELVILLADELGFGKRIRLTPDSRLGRFAIEWRCHTNLELGDSARLGDMPCSQIDAAQHH